MGDIINVDTCNTIVPEHSSYQNLISDLFMMPFSMTMISATSVRWVSRHARSHSWSARWRLWKCATWKLPTANHTPSCTQSLKMLSSSPSFVRPYTSFTLLVTCGRQRLCMLSRGSPYLQEVRDTLVAKTTMSPSSSVPSTNLSL